MNIGSIINMTQHEKNLDDQPLTLASINEIYAQKQNEIVDAMEDWQYAVTFNNAMDRIMVNNYRYKGKSNELIILTNDEKEVINEIRQKYRPDLLRRAIFGG